MMNPYILIGGLFGAIIGFTPLIIILGWWGVFAMIFTLMPVLFLAMVR